MEATWGIVPRSIALCILLSLWTASAHGEAPPRGVDLLVTTDRVLYRPGQQIHIRALALDDTSRRAQPDLPVIFEVRGHRYNRLLIEIVKTDQFGVRLSPNPSRRNHPSR